MNYVDFSSPYNFIELNKKVFPAYSAVSGIPDARMLTDQFISGEIEYTLTAKTPIIFEDKMNTLTASMIRGLVRSNLQILGFTSLERDIEDRTYKYRNIVNGANRKEYSNVMGAVVVLDGKRRERQYRNIRAGIMRQDKDGYYIVPTRAFGGKGFFKLNIPLIQKNDRDWREHYNVSYKSIKNIFDFQQDDRVYIKGNKRVYFGKNLAEPFIKKVSWEGLHSGISAIGETGVYSHDAYLLNSGFYFGKTSVYIIPVGDVESKVYKFRISSKYAHEYLINTANAMNGENKEFYSLPKKGEEKPVFFIHRDNNWQSDKTIEFGFTMLFPVSYRHSVKKGLPLEQMQGIVDYDMALFGFSDKQKCYGGRLSFLDPIKVIETGQFQTSLFLPPAKPQSISSYVKRDNNLGYNADEFDLNGIKQYWLHEGIVKTEELKRTASIYKGVNEGSTYQGKIFFYNLRDDELGLLLWSIGLNDGCDQNIGAGKPYGFGRIEIKVTKLKRNNTNNTWAELDMNTWDCQKELLDPKEYLYVYRKSLNKFLGGHLKNNQRLQNFFLMKNVHTVPDDKKIRYSKLNAYKRIFEFPRITNVTTSKKWLIVPEEEVEIIPQISWSIFLATPIHFLGSYHLEKEIYEAYKELTITLELFRKNKKYIIRDTIWHEYVEINEKIEGLINKYNDKKKRNATEDRNITENIENCLEDTRIIQEEMDICKKQFDKEAEPVFEVISEYPVFDADEKTASVNIKMITASGCVPAKIENVFVLLGEQAIYIEDSKFYLEDGESKTIGIKLNVSNEAILNAYVTLEIVIKYQIRLNNEVKNLIYENELEIPLVQGTYCELKNPYSSWLGNPISDKNMFFGRRAMMHDIMEKVESCSSKYLSGRNIIIYGQKRTGKSTIMHFVKETLQQSVSRKYVVVDIGNVGSVLQIDRTDNETVGNVNLMLFFKRMIDSVEEVLEDEFEELYEALVDGGFQIPSLNGISSVEAMLVCEQFFENLANRLLPDKRIVLLIDEFTYFYDLIVKGQLDGNFMRFWKAFIQNTRICTILVGQDFMDDFRSTYPNEFGSSDFIRITYLDSDATKDLIEYPFERSNGYYGFSPEAINIITQLTAGNAFFTMHLCSMLVSYLNEKKQAKVVTPHITEMFLQEHWLNVDSSKRIDRPFFESLYNDGSRKEWDDDNLILLRAVALGEKNDGWAEKNKILQQYSELSEEENSLRKIPYCEEKLNRLIFRDVISEKNGRLKIRVQLFSRWLITNY